MWASLRHPCNYTSHPWTPPPTTCEWQKNTNPLHLGRGWLLVLLKKIKERGEQWTPILHVEKRTKCWTGTWVLQVWGGNTVDSVAGEESDKTTLVREGDKNTHKANSYGKERDLVASSAYIFLVVWDMCEILHLPISWYSDSTWLLALIQQVIEIHNISMWSVSFSPSNTHTYLYLNFSNVPYLLNVSLSSYTPKLQVVWFLK